MHPLKEKFFITTEQATIKKGPYWKYLNCQIMHRKEDGSTEKLGSYQRNYSNIYNTFVPFIQDGKYYALYSKDYTCTNVMTLPDCKDIGGPVAPGFCPVDYYVPRYEECSESRNKQLTSDEYNGQFGFMAGCIWGDDSSWKIRYLDLSELNKGIIKNDARFGYISLLNHPAATLETMIDVESYCPEDGDYDVSIATPLRFDLKTGKLNSLDFFCWLEDVNQDLIDNLDSLKGNYEI